MKSTDISQKQESIHYWVNNRIFDLFYPAIKYLIKVPVYFGNSATFPVMMHPYIITLSTEHKDVLETVKLLQERCPAASWHSVRGQYVNPLY